MSKSRPCLCQPSLGRNLELLGWKGKTGLPDSKRRARAAEKSWPRALVSLSSLENRRCVSSPLTAAPGFSSSRVFPWSFAVEATQSLPEIHDSDFDLPKRWGRGSGIKQVEWSVAFLREEGRLSLHPLRWCRALSEDLEGGSQGPLGCRESLKAQGWVSLKVSAPRLCPAVAPIQVWGAERHGQLRKPHWAWLGWAVAEALVAGSDTGWPVALSLLPSASASHALQPQRQREAWFCLGDLAGAPGLFPSKRHGFPLLSIRSFRSEKGKDPTPVKRLHRCPIWPGDTSFIKLWNVTYFFYSEAHTSLGLFWFSWCFKIAVQCALLPRLATVAFGQRSCDPDSQRDSGEERAWGWGRGPGCSGMNDGCLQSCAVVLSGWTGSGK